MRKLFFLWLIALVVCLNSYSQGKVVISNPEDEAISDIVEFDSFYILIGKIVVTGDNYTYIVKLGKDGAIIDDTVFNKNTSGFRGYRDGSDIVLLSFDFSDSLMHTHISYTRLDTLLNVLYYRKYSMPPEVYHIGRFDFTIAPDSSIILASSTHAADTIPSNKQLLFYKISKDGDSMSYHFFPASLSHLRAAYDIQNVGDSNYIYVSNTSIQHQADFIIIDNDLNVLDTVNLGNLALREFSFVPIEGNRFITSYRHSANQMINISVVNKDGSQLKTRQFGEENSETIPAFMNGIVRYNDNFFFHGVGDFCRMSQLHGMGSSSYLVVGCLDKDLNMKWIRKLGHDYYYYPYNIKATMDGGIVLVGIFNDTLNHGYKSDAYVIKLDSNGLITFTTEVSAHNLGCQVFPNPTGDVINVDINSIERAINYKILDISGRFWQAGRVDFSEGRIDVSGLAKGAYIIQFDTGSGSFYSKKFIKL